MKQLELINKRAKRAKPKPCNWILFWPIRECKAKAVVMIKGGAYCSAHAQAARRMFGQGKPIYALDTAGV